MSKKEQHLTDSQILRMKAEEKLKEIGKKSEATSKEADVTRLLHELQVHQIELEMQNEELRQANQSAEAALKKYTMLYDFAPMGYFTLDSDGNICDLNFTGAEMLGDKRISLIDSNFKIFIIDDSKSVFNDFISKIYSNSTKASCSIVLGYEKDHLLPVYIEGLIIGDEQKCLLSVVDISNFSKHD